MVSTNASGPRKQINILQEYSAKWLLKIHLNKMFSFFLNGNQIAKASEYSYLGKTFNSNGSFLASKEKVVEKARRSSFACQRYLDFSKLPIIKYNKLFDSLFLLIIIQLRSVVRVR